ncbi:MAG: hypothetical protein K2Q34_03675 [Alphaproteobacteria bacterium]|nr:hypothetical protein [Alphaproteobacteria bacterium]
MRRYIDTFLNHFNPRYRLFLLCAIALALFVSLMNSFALKKDDAPFIKIVYREPANIFNLMDNVSLWYKDFCKKEYNTYWKEKIGLTQKDQDIFRKYKKLRQKYYGHDAKKSKDSEVLFTSIEGLGSDHIGQVFYGAETMEEAYSKLSNFMTENEIKFLREFYAHFEKRYASILEESKKLVVPIKAFTSHLNDKKLDEYLRKITHFFNASLGKQYTVLYTWFPLKDESSAFPEGEFVVMQCAPDISVDRMPGPDIVLYSLIHNILAHQSLEQKQHLSEVFLKKFKGLGKIERLKIMQEPLAVVFGQILYLKKFNPVLYQNQKYYMNWYNHVWVNVLAKLLAPLLEEAYDKGEIISSTLVETMSDIAEELYKISVNPNQRVVS